MSANTKRPARVLRAGGRTDKARRATRDIDFGPLDDFIGFRLRLAQDAADGVRRTADYVRETSVSDMAGQVKDYLKANPSHALIGAAVAGTHGSVPCAHR